MSIFPYAFIDYWGLVDWTRMVIKDNKYSAISARTSILLSELSLGRAWIELTQKFLKHNHVAASIIECLALFSGHTGKRWVVGKTTDNEYFDGCL